MNSLRLHMGGHDGAALGQLCVTEIGSLIMRAGRIGGLKIRMELPVAVKRDGRDSRGEMDCGWYCPSTRRLLIAWEFDGCNVKQKHIGGDHKRIGNAKKFAGCGALVKVQVLYALRNDLSPWGGRSQADRCRQLLGRSVRVVSDEDLMAPGGIESYIAEARRLAGLPALPPS
jgi:hypothetical protein